MKSIQTTNKRLQTSKIMVSVSVSLSYCFLFTFCLDSFAKMELINQSNNSLSTGLHTAWLLATLGSKPSIRSKLIKNQQSIIF